MIYGISTVTKYKTVMGSPTTDRCFAFILHYICLNSIFVRKFNVFHLFIVYFIKAFILCYCKMVLPITNFTCKND